MVCKLSHGGQAFILIIGGLMQEVMPVPNEGTLNSNIAKQLVWRRNAPYFYQTLYAQELQWPSLCVEWWVNENEGPTDNNDEYRLCHVFYGTHTSGEEKNSLIMAKVYLPNQAVLKRQFRDRPLRPSETIRKNDQSMADKIVVQHQIEHDGEVNRIRHHPHKTNLIATRTPLGHIHLFDKVRFGTVSKSNKPIRVAPTLVLSGHQTEGYSLEWNPHKEGQLLAGSYDGKLSIWDISSREQSKQVRPLTYFNFHNSEIEDVSYNQFHDCVFASCDDEANTALWDTRNPQQPVFTMRADSSPLYSVQFSPLDRHLLATGGADGIIKLWDVRNMSQAIIQQQQSGQISQLRWSNEEREMLWAVCGSSSSLWDLNEGKKRFVHAGHLEQINQMDLHPFEAMTVASVDNSNDIHVFQPTPNIMN